MIIALAITGYVLLGLLGARWVYGYRVRSGAHDGHYPEFEEEETFWVAATTFFLWPLWSLVGLFLGVVWLVTAKPPKSPKQLEEERDEMEATIKRLESELGVKYEVSARDDRYDQWLRAGRHRR